MAVTFHQVTTPEEVEDLAKLAGKIWREYWPALIGEAQTEYMIENFQSLEAIKRDMAEHDYRYWFVVDDELTAEGADEACAPWFARGIAGYTGGHTEPETNRFFISKIYLLAGARGHGYCSRTIEHYDALCRDEGLRAMYLTVNKHNELGTRAYFAKGFEVIDSVETDIGEGFIMDDYIMEKKA